MRRHSSTTLTTLLATLVCAVAAATSALAAPRQVIVNTGVVTNVPKVFAGIVNALLMWSSFVATALFLLGAVFLVASLGNETMSSMGKKVMKGAAIGFAIVLSAWLILSTVIYIVAG